jgi:hypothetical protein
MKRLTLLLFLMASALTAFAVDREHATLVRDATLYVLPGASSEKLVKLDRGRDLVILERTNVDGQPWLKVFATITQEEREPRELTGWLPARGVVAVSTPNADQIIFGEAVDSEQQAEQRGGRKGSAQDAMRLYFRIYDLLPNSPLAGEALWRSADIRWQLEKTDVMARPSSHELDPDVRNGMDDKFMKEIQKKFPHTKWSDLASYELIDNKLCGEWKGLAKCPDRESDMYEHYAHEHPQSPKAAEAMFNAAWRQAALVDIYKTNNENDKSAGARKKALALAQEIVSQYASQPDWKPRALDLIYKLEQNVPVFGNQAD